MDTTPIKLKKPKLPRKRKKGAIKSQGRVWYLNNIKLYYITGGEDEPVCKFWKNSTVSNGMVSKRERIIFAPRPKEFW